MGATNRDWRDVLGAVLHPRPGQRWRRPAVAALPVAVVLLVGVVALALIPSLLVPKTPATAEPTGLTWSDEFNRKAGTAPDPSKWKHDIGGHGWGNGELQYYTNSTSNAAHDGKGNMVITARRVSTNSYSCHYGPCQYTSARLLTAERFAQKYGRFTARIKIPGGQGMWPAFWMLSSNIAADPWPNSGEIDVMENIGKEPGTVWGSLHGPGYSGANAAHGSYTLPNSQAFSKGYHVFTVDWAPDSVTWYVDGIQYSHKTPADIGGNPWVVDDPFFLLLNLAVGGYWPGSPDSTTAFPKQMLIDYVRVYGWNSQPPQPLAYAIQGYASKCIDVPGGTATDGAQLQLWDCNGGSGQSWTFPGDGTIRALGKCMDAAGGATANGTVIQLATCNGGPAQKFVLNVASDLVNPQADRCVDVRDWNSANGARLQLWDCAGTANQKWWLRTP